MRNLLLFLHLAGAILWLGGMSFMMLALRPAAHDQLQPPVRLPLIQQVLRRFFAMVAVSIVLLLVSGGMLLMAHPPGLVPPGWHAMTGLGVIMVLVFLHIFFAPWRRLKKALIAQDLAESGRRMKQITWLVTLNLVLGWLAIAAVLLWR